MDLNDYKKILEVNAILIEVEGSKHYINGEMNADVYDTMKNPDISVQEKTLRLLACVMCNAQGIRLFDVNNVTHINIVRSFPIGLQTALIVAAQSKFFPDKKKALKAQA